MVTHACINRSRRMLTTLIETNALPLRQTTTMRAVSYFLYNLPYMHPFKDWLYMVVGVRTNALRKCPQTGAFLDSIPLGHTSLGQTPSFPRHTLLLSPSIWLALSHICTQTVLTYPKMRKWDLRFEILLNDLSSFIEQFEIWQWDLIWDLLITALRWKKGRKL